jgi:hypothetical protein
MEEINSKLINCESDCKRKVADTQSACILFPKLVLKVFRHNQKLRMFENRVLRRIFIPKREEVADSWRSMKK